MNALSDWISTHYEFACQAVMGGPSFLVLRKSKSMTTRDHLSRIACAWSTSSDSPTSGPSELGMQGVQLSLQILAGIEAKPSPSKALDYKSNLQIFRPSYGPWTLTHSLCHYSNFLVYSCLLVRIHFVWTPLSIWLYIPQLVSVGMIEKKCFHHAVIISLFLLVFENGDFVFCIWIWKRKQNSVTVNRRQKSRRKGKSHILTSWYYIIV